MPGTFLTVLLVWMHWILIRSVLVIPIFQVKKTGAEREVKWLTQNFTASKCLSQDLNPGRLAPAYSLITVNLHCLPAPSQCTKAYRDHIGWSLDTIQTWSPSQVIIFLKTNIWSHHFLIQSPEWFGLVSLTAYGIQIQMIHKCLPQLYLATPLVSTPTLSHPTLKSPELLVPPPNHHRTLKVGWKTKDSLHTPDAAISIQTPHKHLSKMI